MKEKETWERSNSLILQKAIWSQLFLEEDFWLAGSFNGCAIKALTLFYLKLGIKCKEKLELSWLLVKNTFIDNCKTIGREKILCTMAPLSRGNTEPSRWMP